MHPCVVTLCRLRVDGLEGKIMEKSLEGAKALGEFQ